MRDHDPEHEVQLDEILAGDEDGRAAFQASALARCAACAELVEEVLELEAVVSRAGRWERDDLAQALGESGRATEGEAEAALRRHVTAARADDGSPSPAAPAPQAGRWVLWVAAAASIALLVHFARRPGEGPVLPETPLGSTLGLARPVGPVPSYAPFRWKVATPVAGWFVVKVYGDRGDQPRLLLASPRLRDPEWTPPTAATAAWPDSIRWTVELYRDGDGATVVESRSAEASLTTDG